MKMCSEEVDNLTEKINELRNKMDEISDMLTNGFEKIEQEHKKQNRQLDKL